MNKQKNLILETDKPIIKIGAAFPLTGNLGSLGQDYKKAIDLRLSQISKDSKFEYQFIAEDDQFKTQQSALNAKKLITVDNIDILMSFFSTSGAAIAPIAQENKTIHLSLTWDNKIAKIGNYNFTNTTPPRKQIELMTEIFVQKNIQSVSIIGVVEPGTNQNIEIMKEVFAKNNIQIKSIENVQYGTKNFSMNAAKLIQSNPDIYIVILMSPELEIFAKIMKEYGNTKPMTSTEVFSYSSDYRLFEGMWYIDTATGDKQYVEAFEQVYNSSPYPVSVYGYDYIDMIVKICEKYEEKPTNEQIIAELFAIQDDISTIGKISVNKYGVFDSDPVLKIIKNGKPKLLHDWKK
jgi:ABC-type branched-subunit amino acid transport system substrate-binding protein